MQSNLNSDMSPRRPPPERNHYFCDQSRYFTISNGIFKFNFLALVDSEIIGGPRFTLGGPVPPERPLAEKFFVHEASTLPPLIVFLISTF